MKKGTKVCKSCNVEKYWSDFYKTSGRTCKICHVAKKASTRPKLYSDDLYKECSICRAIKNKEEFYQKRRQCKECYNSKEKIPIKQEQEITKETKNIREGGSFPLGEELMSMVFGNVCDGNYGKYLFLYDDLRKYVGMIDSDAMEYKDFTIFAHFLSYVAVILDWGYGEREISVAAAEEYVIMLDKMLKVYCKYKDKYDIGDCYVPNLIRILNNYIDHNILPY